MTRSTNNKWTAHFIWFLKIIINKIFKKMNLNFQWIGAAGRPTTETALGVNPPQRKHFQKKPTFIFTFLPSFFHLLKWINYRFIFHWNATANCPGSPFIFLSIFHQFVLIIFILQSTNISQIRAFQFILLIDQFKFRWTMVSLNCSGQS